MRAALSSSRETICQSALSHMLARLDKVELQDEPYPHFYLTEVLPEALYWQLLELLPTNEHFLPVDSRHYNSDGERNRGFFPLDEERLNRLSADQCEFFLGIQEALRSEQLKKSLFRALSAGLAYRFGIPPAEAESLEAYPSPRIYRETNGYFIAPHPDTRKKIVTVQLALPADESQLELGTAMYERSILPADLVSNPRGFRKVGQYPFAPNTAFAFVVLNTIRLKSWHGRDELGEFAGVRNTILNIYYAREEYAGC